METVIRASSIATAEDERGIWTEDPTEEERGIFVEIFMSRKPRSHGGVISVESNGALLRRFTEEEVKNAFLGI